MDSINGFLTEMRLKGRMSENTIRSYGLDLNKLKNKAEKEGFVDIDRLSFDFLKNYTDELKASGLSAATVARSIVSIKAYYKYLLNNERIPFDPAEDLKSPKIEQKELSILTRTQIKRLLEAPDVRTPKGQRDAAILYMMYATGIRVSEVINAKVSDVDLQIGSIELRGRKKDRIVPFDKETKNVLLRYLQDGRRHLIQNTSEELLFVNVQGEILSRQGVWKSIKKYAQVVEIEDTITPKILRHSFAAHMIERGADIDAVQFMMGHVSSASMNRYMRETKDYIRDVYDSTH